MKLIKKQVENFNPFSIEIRIESEEEVMALKNLSCLDITLPRIVKEHTLSSFTVGHSCILTSFLNNLHSLLTKS